MISYISWQLGKTQIFHSGFFSIPIWNEERKRREKEMRKVKEGKDNEKKKKEGRKQNTQPNFPLRWWCFGTLNLTLQGSSWRTGIPHGRTVCKAQENSERGSGLETKPRSVRWNATPNRHLWIKTTLPKAARCPEHEQAAPKGKCGWRAGCS